MSNNNLKKKARYIYKCAPFVKIESRREPEEEMQHNHEEGMQSIMLSIAIKFFWEAIGTKHTTFCNDFKVVKIS